MNGLHDQRRVPAGNRWHSSFTPKEPHMPYSIVTRRNQYCVIKDDDGRVMGCHPTREQAQAQLTALNLAERRYRLEVLP